MIRANAIRNFVSEFYGCYGISNLCFVQSVKLPEFSISRNARSYVIVSTTGVISGVIAAREITEMTKFH